MLWRRVSSLRRHPIRGRISFTQVPLTNGNGETGGLREAEEVWPLELPV